MGLIECMFSYEGSIKHRYIIYKTLFLRRTRYYCANCGHKITAQDYDHWKEMNRLKKRLLNLDLEKLHD